MGFNSSLYYGLKKMRAATLLGDILHLRRCTKNPLKCVHINSKYGNIVVISDSATQESVSISAREKVWVA